MMKDHFFLIPRTGPLLIYILPLTQLNSMTLRIMKKKKLASKQSVAKKKTKKNE